VNRNRPGCNREPHQGGRRFRCMRCGEDGSRGPRHNAAGCKAAVIPLWWRAVLSRIGEPGRPFGGERRHPRAKLGDSFGCWEVVELLAPDYTCNERVRVRCPHGFERDSYVFNLRKTAAKSADTCRHNQKLLREMGLAAE
jgi:hypothetical protein